MSDTPMNAVQAANIAIDIGLLLRQRGILLPDRFDQTKVDSIAEDAALASDIAALLERHGVNVPDRVERIIAIIPLFAGLIK